MKSAKGLPTKRRAPTRPSKAKPTEPRKAHPPGEDRRRVALLARFRDDPALAPVVDDFDARASEGGRTFGANGLKVKGKLFALFTQDTLVVKLPKDRVAVLVAEGVGRPFDPGHGRLMKEWLTVTDARASWFELAKEAHDFVAAAAKA